jgi:Na+-translocating ferredoxin:NAD+ oxidoreductase RnfG subunit
MKKFANSNTVNYGIALALFGILCFSLMSSVEGFKEGKTATANKKIQKAVTDVVKKMKMTPKVKEGITKKTKN